jgi:hypothetical protein
MADDAEVHHLVLLAYQGPHSLLSHHPALELVLLLTASPPFVLCILSTAIPSIPSAH